MTRQPMMLSRVCLEAPRDHPQRPACSGCDCDCHAVAVPDWFRAAVAAARPAPTDPPPEEDW